MRKTNPIHKIWNFIKYHPIWTTTIICFIFCFINGYKEKQFNIPGYTAIAMVIIAAISPYIRKLRRDKQAKRDADYLAKKIGMEIKSTIDGQKQENPASSEQDHTG